MSEQNRMEQAVENKKGRSKSSSGSKLGSYAKAFFPLVLIAVLSVLVFMWLGKYRGYSLEGEIEGFKRITTAPTTTPSVLVLTFGATPEESDASDLSESAQAEIETSDP